MKYNEDLKSMIAFIKRIKVAKDEEMFLTMLGIAFNEIKEEKYLNNKGTNLIKMIIDSKTLKEMQIKLEDRISAVITLISVKEFENNIGLVVELFKGKDVFPYRFIVYDTSIFSKNIKAFSVA